ncbi:MAG TPA: hypothetical protein EYQ60_04970 [Myxococcales bacterium]|nr:hypothetical protein [Myxococcales bacterium]HIK84680.1 hypothetical protein [Myxococcales bacterium]
MGLIAESAQKPVLAYPPFVALQPYAEAGPIFPHPNSSDPMGRSAGVRSKCSLNNGNNSKGKQLEGQAKSLTKRLVPFSWACQGSSINPIRSSIQKRASRGHSLAFKFDRDSEEFVAAWFANSPASASMRAPLQMPGLVRSFRPPAFSLESVCS